MNVINLTDSEVRKFLGKFLTFEDLPPLWGGVFVKEVNSTYRKVRGARPEMVFYMLKTIDEITESAIRGYFSGLPFYRGRRLSDRYIKCYWRILRKSYFTIDNMISNPPREVPKNLVYVPEYVPLKEGEVFYFEGMDRDFTEEEQEIVRHLSILGSRKELKDYIKSLSSK